MKVLVTGAFGFTGRHFTKIARAQGHEVIASQVDLKNRAGLKSLVLQTKPDAAVHLAAISFVGHINTSDFYTINVIGTLNLLDALAALPNPPQNILLASSANVYGNCDHSPIREDQMPLPVNHYGMSKLGMEYMARAYLNKLPLFFVRPFNYTGPGQAESFFIPKLVAHFKQQAGCVELGNLDVEREFNDVRFVCEAYLRLLSSAKVGEVYNICSGNPVSLQSVIGLLNHISGYSLKVTVNGNYMRSNEVHRLCGCPNKLISVIGKLPSPTLQETLQWMLESPMAVSL